MKNTKKLIAFLLSFALVLSCAYVQPVKAADATNATSVTVSLRMDSDRDTIVAPVNVTMQQEDLQNDFGIGLATGEAATYSPLRAFAKYLSKEKNVAKEDMAKYIIMMPSAWGGSFVTGLCTSGDALGAAGIDEEVSWMYSVNGVAGEVAMDQYPCKEGDVVELYGSYYHITNYETYEAIQSTYAFFDKKEYEATVSEPVEVMLQGKEYAGYDAQTYASVYKDVTIQGASVYAALQSDTQMAATAENSLTKVVTDANGKAVVSFTTPGTYVLSAGKMTEDGHNLVTRPYAVVKVTEKTAIAPQPSKKPAQKPTPVVTKKPQSNKTVVKKPATVKKVKVKVANSKKAKKKVTVTWKKATNAKKYQVYVSKNTKKNFKKKATVKKNKTVFRLKKGTYYVKVRGYNASGKTVKKGKFSKSIKFTVK